MITSLDSHRSQIFVIGAGQLARMMIEESNAVDCELIIIGATSDEACDGVGIVERVERFDADSISRVIRSFGYEDPVVTFDHEVIGTHVLEQLEQFARLAPSARQMMFSHKDIQRTALATAGFPVPRHSVITGPTQLTQWLADNSAPWLAKAAFGGYDGRGVMISEDAEQIHAFVDGCGVAVCEELLDLTAEASVIVARNRSGEVRTWPVFDTVQVDGMCHEVTYPSTLSGDVQHELVSLARRIADHVEAEGVLAVEFFIVGESCLVNELAPRPHNSGHLTIEGSITSQFANHLTGVMDRALGDTSMAHPHVAMVNIVGGPNCDGLQRDSGLYGFDTASVHMYGKTPRPGRKLGHATAWGDDAASAIATAREFASRYTPDR